MFQNAETGRDIVRYLSQTPMPDLLLAEYESLRATIRERGTLRMWAILAGLTAWGVLAIALLVADLQGAVSLVPFLVLAATFEINFFIHTGVERIGRYVQVFFEEPSKTFGWETTAMRYGTSFPGGLDSLFITIFALSAAVNFFSSFATATRRPGWVLLSFLAHAIFAWRLVTARRLAADQRATDLEKFRSLRAPSNPSN
jgi:hypothetical protein